MPNPSDFDLEDFLPYALNRAAEVSSRDFQKIYKEKYGMLRTEWRVLFHLGRYGDMTAKAICDRADIHKTKVSRAVAALQAKSLLTRRTQPQDRRHETLCLTPRGQQVFEDLNTAARSYDARLAARFTPDEQVILRRCLRTIAQLRDVS